MSKYTDNYAAAAAANGLRYDETNRVIYGQKDGYDLLIYAEDKSYPYVMTIDTSAKRSSGGLTREESKELVKSCKGLTGVESDGKGEDVSARRGKAGDPDRNPAGEHQRLYGVPDGQGVYALLQRLRPERGGVRI